MNPVVLWQQNFPRSGLTNLFMFHQEAKRECGVLLREAARTARHRERKRSRDAARSEAPVVEASVAPASSPVSNVESAAQDQNAAAVSARTGGEGWPAPSSSAGAAPPPSGGSALVPSNCGWLSSMAVRGRGLVAAWPRAALLALLTSIAGMVALASTLLRRRPAVVLALLFRAQRPGAKRDRGGVLT